MNFYYWVKFSTKAEYGLIAMVNLSKSFPKIKSLKTISDEEMISLKYLERLMGYLRDGGLVKSTKGKSGGYVLSRNPEEITAGDVIEIMDGPISPMKCSTSNCSKECSSRVVWMELEKQIKKTLNDINLKKLTLK